MDKSESHMAVADDTIKAPAPPTDIKPKGYNPKNIFGKSLRSDGERLDRLERAVQDMRNEFDSIKPSVKRLMAVEGDIQDLIVELRRLSDDPGLAAPAPRPTLAPQPIAPPPVMAPPKAPAPVMAPKKSFQKKSPPPVSNGQATVYDVRVGEHPGKTRIVLDVNAKTNYSLDIDNNEKIMVVELPSAGWSAAASRNFGRSPAIASYSVEPAGDGQMLIFQLKRAANVLYQDDIPALNGSGRRIVIDLGR